MSKKQMIDPILKKQFSLSLNKKIENLDGVLLK